MGAVYYYNTVFSGLSIAFMESFGYYKGAGKTTVNVNNVDHERWAMEEYFYWGKGKGCEIFSGSCVTHPSRCNTGSFLCSPDFYSMGEC